MAKMKFDEDGALDEPCISCEKSYIEDIWNEWCCDEKECLQLFNKDYNGDAPIVKLASAETKKEVQIKGQVSIEEYMRGENK